MTDETHYEAESTRTRGGIAAYLRRIARRLRRGERIPVDED